MNSREARLDRDEGVTAQGTEELIELTYLAQVTPWLIIQPDIQYIGNSGAGIPDLNDPAHNLQNEPVAGARTIMIF